MLPFSVVISLSYRCNSTCATCDVWKKPNDDMTPQEWRNVFRHLGHTPFYMTFTGGEPFLRADMHEVVIAGYEECLPEVITIPTNGISVERNWMLARDVDGNPILWIQRQRKPLLAPPSRQVRFDVFD